MRMFAAMLLLLMLCACARQGSFERTGKDIDEAVEDVRGGVEEAIDDVREGVEDAGEDVERRTRRR
ncbi:MAG TPA: hypothetical protein VIH25_06830 [Steroidobacteraceae bacterium]